MDSLDREVARLWRVNRTIHELIRDRGYAVSQEEIDLPLADFREMATRGAAAIDRNLLHFYATHRQDPTQLIFVYFSDERNVGVTTMRKFLQQLEDKNIGRGIIVYQEKMTPAAHKVIDAMRNHFELEDFHEVALLVNITQHHLVPRHRVLSDDEKKALLQRYRLKENQLPRIQVSDPVARYYGMKRGQVCEITRREFVNLFEQMKGYQFPLSLQPPRLLGDIALTAFVSRELLTIDTRYPSIVLLDFQNERGHDNETANLSRRIKTWAGIIMIR